MRPVSVTSDPAPDPSIVADPSSQPDLDREVARRRTFAIISHPDAGKTTLTEKLLLYAGAIELAGAVRGRRDRKKATSDWMELEQQRGISITSAALEFELQGRRMSLLDTPGHRDFSEDTYRALIAADSVVMVIDAANGVEEQTRKLFEVCRRHRLPILTFVNKFDRPARDPLELMDDLERTLGISAAPVNWPIGSAERFRGVYDIQHKTLLRYEREAQGQYRAPVGVSSLDDPDA
jgi:peptide chain release factor 3